MNPVMTHLKPADYVVSTWSGGTTTQVAIAPKGAVYADRDFLWRISSATVDLEKSDFTALPDYFRYIATLDGAIDVVHDQSAPIHLDPYKVHAFDGGAQTSSEGRCRDFNLMLRKGACEGLLESVALEGGASACASLCGEAEAAERAEMLIYLCEGSLRVEACGEAVVLAAGEAVYFEAAKCADAKVTAEGPAVFMKAQMWK